MAHRVRKVEYFYATIRDVPGSAYELLGQLAESGINLLAFTALPTGPQRVQLTLFPRRPGRAAARGAAGRAEPRRTVHGDARPGRR